MIRVIIVIIMFFSGASAFAAQPPANGLPFSKDVVGLEGKEVTMLVIEYAPGQASSVHRHNAQVFVYVLEGSVEMAVQGGQTVTLVKGQTFYETPNDIHTVSRNASKTEPAKFLVFMIKDKGAAPTVRVE